MWTLKVPAKNIGTIGLVLTVKADNVKGAYLVLFSLGFFYLAVAVIIISGSSLVNPRS